MEIEDISGLVQFRRGQKKRRRVARPEDETEDILPVQADLMETSRREKVEIVQYPARIRFSSQGA